MLSETHNNRPHKTSRRYKSVLALFLATGLFFLLTEHRAHFFGALPYLLLLACPLAHVFLHGGQRHGRGGEQR